MENPFVIKAYESNDLFCDREEELQLMLRTVLLNESVTLSGTSFSVNDVFLSRWMERL